MKEKLGFLGKVFLISLAGCLAGSIIFVAVTGFFNEAYGILYLLAGISTAAFYMNFIKEDQRTVATHIVTDFALIIGIFISQFANFMINYADMINDDFILGRTMGTLQKTFYVYFSKGGFNKFFIGENGTPSIMTDQGSFYVWTLFIFYTLVAFIGMYIIFGISKIIEIGEPKDEKRKQSRRKK